jgi:RimJ/RimL family protein N-acetyltransferase
MIGEKDCWNQGYGTEATRLILEFAFGELGLHRVWLDVDSDNRRARRAYEKAGFKQEGIKRDHMYYDGAFHDIVLMSILSSDTLPEGAVADES